MAESSESLGRMQILTPGERRFGFLRSFIVTLVAVAAIVLITIFFAVRMEGGRAFVADRLGRHLGTEVTIEKARIGWPYALVIHDPASKDSGSGPAFMAQSLRIAFDVRGRCRVSVHKGTLRLVQDECGEWSPGFFGRMGDLPSKNVAHIARLTSPFRKRVILEMSDCAVRWIDSSGREVTSVNGMYFQMLPVTVPERRMNYYRLSVYSFADRDMKVHDVEREWLAGEDQSYLELHGSGGLPSRAGGFWSAPVEEPEKTHDREKAGRETG